VHNYQVRLFQNYYITRFKSEKYLSSVFEVFKTLPTLNVFLSGRYRKRPATKVMEPKMKVPKLRRSKVLFPKIFSHLVGSFLNCYSCFIGRYYCFLECLIIGC